FDKQQNVKLLLTTPGGPVTRWAHAEALTHESAYFRRALADAEAGADGVVAIDLPAMSEASLDFLLQLLHNRSARLPRNVSDLCDILNDQRKLEALSGKRELDQAALRQIYRVAEAGDVATLVKKVDDWTSDLGLISIAIAARNFDTIAQSGALTTLPPEALARVLSSPDLQLHEHKVVLHTLGWIQHYCAQHPEISAEDLAHQALYKGQSLVQLLRFEHLTLEEFAKAMAENRVLHDSEFQRWYSWLASGAAAVGMPHRSPRIPFLVKTSNRGQRLHVFWRIPVDKHLGHARQSRYEIIALAQSPSFELCGDEWRLQFNLSPYGPYLLTLQRLFTKDSPRFMRAQVDALFPMDGHSRSFS
ncbi:MAG: hypothetical protein KDK78_09615, partial [Chlamydiia bacterium]|nr:hypothetical protein [Chlamydiia bacterium]